MKQIFDFNKENNNKGPKFQVGDYVRIWKFQNIFARDCVLNLSEKAFVIKKVKNTFLWTYDNSDHKEEETVGTFYEKVLQK